jgi:hypothetical protein
MYTYSERPAALAIGSSRDRQPAANPLAGHQTIKTTNAEMRAFEMKTMLRLVAVASLLVAFAFQAGSQTTSSSVTGHVIDQSKGAVANAEVKLIDELTKAIVATTNTNATGDFTFTAVPPSTYTVVVSATGYKEVRKVDNVLYAAQTLATGTYTLPVGTVQQSVTIQADITPLQTESSERSGVLDTEQTDNLLSVGRDTMSMTRVIPGVYYADGSGGFGSASMSQQSMPTVNGVNSEYNLATIDGVTGNTRGYVNNDTPINLDAVQEVSLNESNYQAQYGKTSGGEFNFVTKSGTNKFHGGLYEYFRNEDLNANSFFDKYGLTPSTYAARPRYRYNTAGGTIGGPIYWPGRWNHDRSRLFFFVSIEDSPITSPDGLKYYRVPTQLETQGNFSQTYKQGTATATPINIAYPGKSANTIGSATGCPVNGTPTAAQSASCIPGNIITAADAPAGWPINAQTQSLLTTEYNNTLGASGIGSNGTYSAVGISPTVTDYNYNYYTNYSAFKPVNQYLFRIDYAPWEKLHMFFRGEMTTVNNNDYSSPANDLPWLMRVNYQNTQPNFVYNIVYSFTPTLVNEFNIGTSGWSEHQLYASSVLAQVTLNPNAFDLPSLYSGVNPLNLYPGVTFGVTDAANYAWDSRFPMADQVRDYNATDSVTKVLGRHTLKAGVDVETDEYLQINHNRVGTFTFSTDSSDPNDTNFAFANATLGVIDKYSQDTQLLNYDPRTNSAEWYYQDTWKPFHNLTIDAGIRNSWALGQRLKRGNNFVPSLFSLANAPTLYQYGFNSSGVLSAINPANGQAYPKSYAGLMVPGTGNLNNGILYVNTSGYPQGTVYGAGLKWAPRVGFAWQVRPGTVIRSGFGMFYNVRARSGQEGDLTNNAPTTNGPTQYYSSATSTSGSYYAAAGINNLNSPFGIGHGLPLHSPVVYAEETQLGVQQQLKFGTVLDVAYVGTFTKHATDAPNINEVPYGAEFALAHQYCSAENSSGACTTSSILPDQFFPPYPGFGTITYQYYNLTANYNALQARVTRRFRGGLEFGGAYTFSRAMDYGSCSATSCTESYMFGAATYQNLRTWNYGPAGFDIKHNLVVNYLYALPKPSLAFGSQSGWNNTVTRQLLDGWQLNGIATHLSGAPEEINLSLSNGQNVTGGGDGARAVLTCDPWHSVQGTRSFHEWFNSACVEPPLAGSAAQLPTVANPSGVAATQYSTGSGVFAPKVNFFLPGFTNFDTALFKNWPIREKFAVQLRAETYNTFNHTEWAGANGTATFANANSQGSGNPQTASTFGQLTSTFNPRYMQIALRIDF